MKLAFRILAFGLACAAVSLGTGAAAARAAIAGIGPGAIAAIVRDAAGKPLAGVHVVASGPAEREADTGASGYVALQALPLGTYTLRAVRGGYDPLERTVAVTSSVASGWKVLALRLLPVSFASLRGGPGAPVLAAPISGGDPNVAHQLGSLAGVTLVPGISPLSSGVSLDGTSPQEARFTLDGIPLAGGGSTLALRARNALALDTLELSPNALGGGDAFSSRGSIAGTINYRSVPIGAAQDLTLAAGYDTNFGSYQLLRASQTAGRFGYAVEAVTGSGANRAQTFKFDYDASSATRLDLAVYGSQTSAEPSAGLPATTAPAYALGLTTAVDAGTLRLRTYGSALNGDRLRGNQFVYDVPVGSELFSLGYERSTESVPVGAAQRSQTTSSLLLRGEAPLGQAVRFSLADVLSSGSGLPARGDPQVGLAVRAGDRLTLQASAGSSYASGPLAFDNPARPAPGNAPETSFAYRFFATQRVASGDALTLDVFRIEQANRFASLSNARSSGLNFGFSHDAGATGLSAPASLSLLHSAAYGTAQPAWRYAATGELAANGVQFAGLPYSSARVELSYRRRDGLAFHLGTSYYGANNGLGPTATTLTDAGVGVPLGKLFSAQFGVRNLFGSVPPPSAAYLYGGPGELTFSLGRNLALP